MKFEHSFGKVMHCFPIFRTLPCCGCGKQFFFESGYKVKISETYRGYRYKAVCGSCANTNEDAYNLAVFGRRKITVPDTSFRKNEENISIKNIDSQNISENVKIEELFEEAIRVAIENGHQPTSFKKNSNNHAPYGANCEVCDCGLQIIGSSLFRVGNGMTGVIPLPGDF